MISAGRKSGQSKDTGVEVDESRGRNSGMRILRGVSGEVQRKSVEVGLA